MPKPKASPEALTNLYESLKIDAELSQNYVVLIISSCLIASFGLISNSAAVIIGAMIIAPLMLPLRSALLPRGEAKGERSSRFAIAGI